MNVEYYDTVLELTSAHLSENERAEMVRSFSQNFGWHPSDRFSTPNLEIAHDHLLIEHGLENAAVISFLKDSRRFSGLSYSEINSLLKISYNNLVDWHIIIEPEFITFLYNRTSPFSVIEKFEISRTNYEKLRYEAFEVIVGRRPSPNLPALDNAFIDTISFWKKNLSAELGHEISNENFSTLFNALIFLRAIEDTFRRNQTLPEDIASYLLSKLETTERPILHDLLLSCFQSLTSTEVPTYILDLSTLRIFDTLPKQTIRALISDFYRNRFAPYEYDFSLMSKHALSRIYEHYVSRLRIQDTPQLSLFPQLPEEEKVKAYGGIYTPQFIAKFFAKFLKNEFSLSQFQKLKYIDPACGSGIFLRTLIETQLDSMEARNELNEDALNVAFANIYGTDVDPNACNASKLSLSLLYLVLNGVMPQALNISCKEAIEYYSTNPINNNTFDVVVANPPFVSLDTQSVAMRERLVEYLGDLTKGRADVSLAFIKIALDLLKPGGYGCFVLPHSFLLSNAASGIRQFLAEKAWIRCLADLSSINVFDNTGAYIILLIFQKKTTDSGIAPTAKIIKCNELVGKALEDSLKNLQIENKYYSIYNVEQNLFEKKEWLLLPPAEEKLKRKMNSLPQLKEYFYVRQGFISGADDIFIVDKNQIPKGEEKAYVPVLHDRDMKAYAVPKSSNKYFFYPYLGNEKMTEVILKDKFSRTWKYLLSQREILSQRKSLAKYKKEWWEPIWPRLPENMMRAKIVTPHLVLGPKFSIDSEGKYAVSHCPLIYPKDSIDDVELLKIYIAILNSSVCSWYISTHSHKFQRGYLVLEPATLGTVPIPQPSDIPHSVRKKLIALVDKRCTASSNLQIIEHEIDMLVFTIYGLSETDMVVLGDNVQDIVQ